MLHRVMLGVLGGCGAVSGAFGQAVAVKPSPHAFAFKNVEGDSTLRIDGMVQARYLATIEAQRPGGEDAIGFQLARARFGFGGQLGSPALTYRLFMQGNNLTEFVLFDAWTQYAFAEGWSVRLGQFKLPFDRERYLTSPFNLLTAERSILDPVFYPVRGQGVQVGYESERVRWFSAFSDGQRTDQLAFNDPAEADYAVTSRAELRLGPASWNQFNTMTAFAGDKFGSLVGAGVHFQEGGHSAAQAGLRGADRALTFTGDLGFEGDGWSLMGLFVGRTLEDGVAERTDLGFFVQGSLALGAHHDVFARYALLDPDDARAANQDDFSTITAGVNYYVIPRSEALRVTAEVTYAPSATTESASLLTTPNTGQGLLRDSAEGQVSLLVQLQVLF